MSDLRCGSKTKGGRGPCRAFPVPGKRRCRMHGGHHKGAITPEGKERARLAPAEGRRRWNQRMMALKAAGLIDKRPSGWPKGVPRKRENLMTKAIEIVTEAATPAGQSSGLARDLEELTGKSVTVIRDVLSRKVAKKSYYRKVGDKTVRVDPDMKLLALQTQTALEVVKTKIRVDVAAFQEHGADRRLAIAAQILAGQSEDDQTA